MKKLPKPKLPTIVGPRFDPDPDIVRSVITRRLAARFAMTAAVAATVAALAGLGPDARRG